MSRIVFDLATTSQGKCIVFIVLTLVVTAGHNRAAELKQGKCSNGHVSCENGECIKGIDVCDGIANCSDGSDEIHPICLEYDECPAKTFRCAYGACIDESLKCNGRHDCADQSDELSLSPSCALQWLTNVSSPCSKDQFQCRNGECIPGIYMCDGEVNCLDRSDESILACYGGKMSNCPLGSFRCAYGGCISSTKKCDSKNDCADGSDEHYLLCNLPKPQTSSMTSTATTTSSTPTRTPPTKPTGRQCITPDHDYTSISRLNCQVGDCTLKKGEAANDNEYFILNCRSPYAQPNDVFVFRCIDGQWQPEKPICQRHCEPLMSQSLSIDCDLHGSKKNCSEGVPPGTDATYQCRDGYQTKEGLLLPNTNKCLKNGQWLYTVLPDCYYRCGILNKPDDQQDLFNPLIFDGVDTVAINHPWNAGLYHFNRSSNMYDMFCGGTLISPFTVLSAAHCFVDELTANRRVANDVWIALGKTKRSWSTEENGMQRIQVENYYIPDKYAGKNMSFLNDVAVLELKTPVKLSRNYGIPMPACLPKTTNKLNRGSIGLLSGWGSTNNGEYPETLQAANLTFQPIFYCREHANKTILDDHFCAYNNEANGSIRQPTVSYGDSGSGFTYKMFGNHFVYGVTSTRTSTKYGFTLSTFTDLTHSTICNFVKTHLVMINLKHSNFPFSDITC